MNILITILKPFFDSIKTGLYKTINSNIPKDVEIFEHIPDESIYYKTISNEDFLYFKNNKVVIFQSDNLSKLKLKFGFKIFCDSTFKTCPKIAYQLFITRVLDPVKNVYYTTSFSIMKNKSKEDYLIIFKKIKEHIEQFLEIGENYYINEIYIDLEFAIGEACCMVYPNAKIKYCIWHMKRAINKKNNSLCKVEIDHNDNNIFILYNMCNQLYLCHPDYVKIVFNRIKEKSENENFNKFLQYFEDQYIKLFNYKRWHYFNDPRNATNNVSESYNSKINNLFLVRPTFFKLIYKLRLEDESIINEYSKRKAGLLGSGNRRTNKTEKFFNSMSEKK